MTRVVVLVSLALLTSGSAFSAPLLDDAPPRLRACCALGVDARIELGNVRTPIIISNVVERGFLGRHRYRGGSVFGEKNGLVYTCRAGLIDLGHVRSAADHAAHLLYLMQHAAGSETITFDGEDARFEVRLNGADPRVAAMRVAYLVAAYHEVHTARGGRTVPIFSEAFSAFSPEDLNSDLLGAQLGIQAAAAPEPYDRAMERLLDERLLQLESVTLPETREFVQALEGTAWNGRAAIPHYSFLLERDYDLSPVRTPYSPSVARPASCQQLLDQRLSLVGSDSAHAVRIVPADGSPPLDGADLASPKSPSVSPGADNTATARPLEGADTLARIRILPLSAFGGVQLAHRTKNRAVAGFTVHGARAETAGGDLSIVRFSMAHTFGGSEIFHFTGIQARSLFIGNERNTDRVYPPVSAWFQDVMPTGWLGFGATLFQLQLDSAATKIRPIEIDIVINPMFNAFSSSFLRRFVTLSLGMSLDSVADELSPRAQAGLRARLRTSQGGFEFAMFGRGRQDVAEWADRGVEAGATITLRAFLGGWRDGLGLLEVDAEVGYAHFAKPELTFPDEALPLFVPGREHSAYAVIRAGLSFDRLAF